MLFNKGGPLSSMLFNMCLEVLAINIWAKVDRYHWIWTIITLYIDDGGGFVTNSSTILIQLIEKIGSLSGYKINQSPIYWH